MLKHETVLLVTLLVMSSVTYAQEIFTISGVVDFPKDGDIYMSLLTKEEWQRLTILSPPPRTIIITLTPEQKKDEKSSLYVCEDTQRYLWDQSVSGCE